MSGQTDLRTALGVVAEALTAVLTAVDCPSRVTSQVAETKIAAVWRLRDRPEAIPVPSFDDPHATLFGQPVGDGLDQEREDAAAAIAIVRKLVSLGVQLDRSGPQPGIAASGWVALTETEADLVYRLIKKEHPHR